MISRIKGSALLLLFLGILFSVPIVAKTWSAHGVAAALATGVLVVLFVSLGPLCFALAGTVQTNLVDTKVLVAESGGVWVLLLGCVLFLLWVRRIRLDQGGSIPGVPVSGWALTGAYFCVLLVFSHAT